MGDAPKRRPSLENLMAGTLESLSSFEDEDFHFCGPATATHAKPARSLNHSGQRRPSLENLLASAMCSLSSFEDDDFGDIVPPAPERTPQGRDRRLQVSAEFLPPVPPPESPSPRESASWFKRKEDPSPREKKMFFSKLQQSRSVVSMSHMSDYGSGTIEAVGSTDNVIVASKSVSLSDIEDMDDEDVVDWIDEDTDEELVVPTLRTGFIPEECDTSPEVLLRSELLKIEDLRFDTLPQSDQLEILKSVEIQYFAPGEHIVTEGDDATGFYLILGPINAEVEVLKKSKGLITRLKQGKCFGEKFFISRREAKRTATIAAVTSTKVGLVTPSEFHKWDNFRLFLLMRTFPLIKTLPKSDQFEMYKLFTHEEFAPGEFIVKQGDFGDMFYIIVEGSADVKELDPEFEDDFDKSISLTRLYEGHSFGEMALIFDEPRTASVVAVDKVSCFVLSKVAFREALSSAKHFHETMQKLIYEILNRREKRAAARAAHLYAPDSSDTVQTADLEAALVATGAFGGTTKFSAVAEKTKIPSGPGKQKGLKINKYQTFEVLGKGSYGSVYLVRNEENGKMYAMKTLLRQSNKWNNLKKTNEIKAEINIMKKLRHDNIVSLEEVIDDPNSREVYLIQELLEGGPILPNEAKTTPLPTIKARAYFRDMLKGVRYLHSKGIVHRDLKPQNMLRTAQDRVKIADFGAAVFTGTKASEGSREVLTAGGTPAFMAPEIYKITRSDSGDDEGRAYSIVYSTKVDVWGLGATLYNMVVGQPPWMADNELELAETVRNMELTYPDETQYIDPHLKNLLARMLDKNPEARLSMDMVYTHDWVTSEGSESLDDGSSSSDQSRSSSTPTSRQSSGSTSSLFSGVKEHSREFYLNGRHGRSDMAVSGLSIDLLRTNSHARKLSGNSKKHMKESVMILADSADESPADSDRSVPPSPGIANRRVVDGHHVEVGRVLPVPSPLLQEQNNDTKYSNWYTGAQDMGSSSTLQSASPDTGGEHASLAMPTDFNEKRSLKSTKKTRMTSSNIITQTGELRKALKIIAPIVNDEDAYSGDTYDDLDSLNSSESDFDDDSDDDDDVFRRRSPAPGLVDPVLPSSMNPLAIRSNSDLNDTKLDLGISEDELLGKKSSLQVKKSVRNMAATRRTSSSFSHSDSASSLSPRIDSHNSGIEHLYHDRDNARDREMADALALPRRNSGRTLHKDAASGLLQRGNSASKMTGKTMSFVLRQKQVQEKQLAAASSLHRKFSYRSNGSSDEEYCRTLSGGDDVDEELSKYSFEDEVVVMDDNDMEDMFNELITPNDIPQIDLQLAPMFINGHGLRKLLVLKTWAGQTNPALNLRYGLAESIVSRHTMEDRTTAIASMEALRSRTKGGKRPSSSSTAATTSLKKVLNIPEFLGPPASILENKTLSGSFDFSETEDDVGYISESDGSHIEIKSDTFESPRRAEVPVSVDIPMDSDNFSTPSSIGTGSNTRSVSNNHLDFSFFGVFDGHGGTGAAEMLQDELHSVFEQRLIFNNAQSPITVDDDEVEDDLCVVKSLTEAVAIVDRRILTDDSMRVTEIENARKEMQTVTEDTMSINKFGLRKELEESENEKMLRKSYLGGLGKAVRSESLAKEGAKPCAFSGSTAVAMIVIRKSGALSTESRGVQSVKSQESNSVDTCRNEVPQGPPAVDTSILTHLMPPVAPSILPTRCGSGGDTLSVQNLAAGSDLTKASSFCSLDSIRGSRISSGGYNSSTSGIRVVIGHVGDCRAVLSDGGTAVELTTDHHPCVPSERARVEAAGGVIRSGRVNGVLAVTRSIGDIMYKQFDPHAPVPSSPLDESKDNGIWAKTQHVISKPDVVDFLVQPTHEFIVLASDGLWEVINIQQAVNFTRQRLYEHGDIQRAAIELIAKAENCGACDNTSVVIACLNQQDRSAVLSTPGKKSASMPRSYSLASDHSGGSRKSESWKMIKRHHSDVLGLGGGSGDSLGSLSYVSGDHSTKLLPVADIDVTVGPARRVSSTSSSDEDYGF